MVDLLALKPEPDRYVLDEEARPLPMFHLSTLLQFGERVALAAVEAERERCKAIAQDAALKYAQGYIVNWNEEFRASSKAEGGMG